MRRMTQLHNAVLISAVAIEHKIKVLSLNESDLSNNAFTDDFD